jgi:hypothetical protein
LVQLRSPTPSHDVFRTTQAKLLGSGTLAEIVDGAVQLQTDIQNLPVSAQVRAPDDTVVVDSAALSDVLAADGLQLQRSIDDRLDEVAFADEAQTRIEPAPAANDEAPAEPSQESLNNEVSDDENKVVVDDDLAPTIETIGLVAGLAAAQKGWYSRRLGLRSLAAKLSQVNAGGANPTGNDRQMFH